MLLAIVFMSEISNPRAIWSLVGTGTGVTAMINLVAILLLRRHVKD